MPGLGNRPYSPLSNNAETGRNSLGPSDLKHNLQRWELVQRAHLGSVYQVAENPPRFTSREAAFPGHFGCC